MPRPTPLPLDALAFVARDAELLGATQWRLRAADLRRPHQGSRARAPGDTLAERCRDFAPLLRPGQAFSHATAAGLWGLPLPEGSSDEPLHVAVPAGRRPRRPGILAHRIDEVTVARARGVPVVAPVDAWVQCASLLPLDDLVAMADALLGRWSKAPEARLRPLTELRAAAAAAGGARGVVRLREALELSRPNVRSPKETALRLLVVRAGLREPELNADVDDDGTWLGMSDLVWRRERVVAEYEGEQHRLDRHQFEKDIRRRERYAEAGWRIVRVTRADLTLFRSELITRLRSALAAAPWR
jgi:hypothetical protein